MGLGDPSTNKSATTTNSLRDGLDLVETGVPGNFRSWHFALVPLWNTDLHSAPVLVSLRKRCHPRQRSLPLRRRQENAPNAHLGLAFPHVGRARAGPYHQEVEARACPRQQL